MNPLFQGAVNGIAALENVAGTGTGTNTDNDTGFGYLCDGTDDSVTRLAGDRAGHYNDVGLTGAACQAEAQTLRVIAGGQRCHDLDITAIAGACVDVEKPGALSHAFVHHFLKHL